MSSYHVKALFEALEIKQWTNKLNFWSQGDYMLVGRKCVISKEINKRMSGSAKNTAE